MQVIIKVYMYRNTFCLLLSTLLFSACATSSLQVGFDDALEQEKQTQSEKLVQFIQPVNKIEACKVRSEAFLEGLPNMQIYWEGECKNGFADGFGRVFIEEFDTIILEELVVYNNNPSSLDVYYYRDYRNNIVFEGKNEVGMMTMIHDFDSYFDVLLITGEFHEHTKASKFVEHSLVNESMLLMHALNNHDYLFWNSYHQYDIINFKSLEQISGVQQGYGIDRTQSGGLAYYEVIENDYIQYDSLPQDYLTSISNIAQEVHKAAEEGMQAQKVAQDMRKQYTSKICNDTKKIESIPDELYFAVCNEERAFAELQSRIILENEKITAQKQASYNKYFQTSNPQTLNNKAQNPLNVAKMIANQGVQLNRHMQDLMSILQYLE